FVYCSRFDSGIHSFPTRRSSDLNPKRGITVVWVEGNHDHGLSDVMSHLVGIDVYQQYEWDFEGVHHLAIHGHQFDRFLVSNRLRSEEHTSELQSRVDLVCLLLLE